MVDLRVGLKVRVASNSPMRPGESGWIYAMEDSRVLVEFESRGIDQDWIETQYISPALDEELGDMNNLPVVVTPETEFDNLSVVILRTGSGIDPNLVLAQEAAGQHDLVNSDKLPLEMLDNAKAVLMKAGVRFLGAVHGDPLFQKVELPKGWKKVGTSHDMWSDLVDHKGRKRAAIFYKAAFYDKRAHIGVVRRYSIEIDYGRLNEGTAVALVVDQGEVIHTTKAIKIKPDDDRYALQDEVQQEAKDWLSHYYPNWEDPAAYWD